MKKKIIIILLSVIILALLIPIPGAAYDDGGTKEYSALMYKVVKWNRLTDDGLYIKTSVYFFPSSLKSIDELWEAEKPHTNGEKPDETDTNKDKVHDIAYPEEWMIKDSSTKSDNDSDMVDVIIDEIYSDCFFASPVIPMPYTLKINGSLDDKWCVGDKVNVQLENIYYDNEQYREEADMISISESNFTPDPNVCYKPVIYLYPEEETEVSVTLDLSGRLTCTYPKYDGGWRVKASPDGTLTDENSKTYNYLYWEGETEANYDLSTGFCVKGEDTAEFLEEALSKLGLTRKEANEFIVYWLPLMENNPYNIISFQTYAYTDSAKLNITPSPDTLIRVFMAWKPSDEFVNIAAQKLEAPERLGFTAVEWGGTCLK